MADQFHGLSQNSKGGTNRDHEDSLISMGFIQPREEVSIPEGMSYLFDMFIQARFSANQEGKLTPREPLTFLDLNQYKELMGVNMSALEASVIMSADSIYNLEVS